MSKNTQNEMNALANQVQAIFAAETGKKLGFAKAKELAAKLSGLRNSNIKASKTEVDEKETFFILPSADGPDYDKHFAAPGNMSGQEIDQAVKKLRAFFSLEAAVDDEKECLTKADYDRFDAFMRGEKDTGEFLTKYATELFGVRYINPIEYFAWDNPNQLVKVTADNIDDLFETLKQKPAQTASLLASEQIEQPIVTVQFSYTLLDENGLFSGWSVNDDGKEQFDWADEMYGNHATKVVQFFIPGEPVYSFVGEMWVAFEDGGASLARCFYHALKQNRLPEFSQILALSEPPHILLQKTRELLSI